MAVLGIVMGSAFVVLFLGSKDSNKLKSNLKMFLFCLILQFFYDVALIKFEYAPRWFLRYKLFTFGIPFSSILIIIGLLQSYFKEYKRRDSFRVDNLKSINELEHEDITKLNAETQRAFTLNQYKEVFNTFKK